MKGFEDIDKMNLADLDRPENAVGIDDEYDDEDYGAFEEEQEAGLNEPAEGDESEEGNEPAEGTALAVEEERSEESGNADMLTVGDLEGGAVAEYGEHVSYEEEPTELPRPQGEHYYIEARITRKEMNAFMFGHSYRSPLIIIVTVIAVVWALATLFTQSDTTNIILVIIVVAIVLVGLPFSTWNRGRSTIRNNPIYNDIFHFMFDEWGLHLKVSDRIVEVEWKDVRKYMFLSSVTAVYTGRANAFLLPTKDIGDQAGDLKAFLIRHKGGR